MTAVALGTLVLGLMAQPIVSQAGNEAQYFAGPSDMTYDDAVAYCASHDATLARIYTSEQNEQALGVMKSAFSDPLTFWIDGTDYAGEGTWVWSDGTVLSYTNWAPGEPNSYNNSEHCLQVYANMHATNFANLENLWNDYFCDHTTFFLCQLQEITTPEEPSETSTGEITPTTGESCTAYENTANAGVTPFLELPESSLDICCDVCGSMGAWPNWCLVATFEHASGLCSISDSYGTREAASNVTLLNSPEFSCAGLCGGHARSGECYCHIGCTPLSVPNANGYCCPDYEETCADCVSNCPPVDEPVCGFNGITYENECYAECDSEPISHAGECVDCGSVCPPVDDPVCGTDGVTYENECVVLCRGWAVAYHGPCNASA